MWKAVVAVVAGFILWSVIWVGGNQLLARLSPKHFQPPSGESPSVTALIVMLALAVVCSVASGALAGRIWRQGMAHVWVLSGILLAVGIMVERGYWTVLPLWYHLAFLAILVPLTIAGGLVSRMAQ